MKSKFNEALNLAQNGKLNKAKNICEEILKKKPIIHKFIIYSFTPAPFKKAASSSSGHLGFAG